MTTAQALMSENVILHVFAANNTVMENSKEEDNMLRHVG